MIVKQTFAWQYHHSFHAIWSKVVSSRGHQVDLAVTTEDLLYLSQQLKKQFITQVMLNYTALYG